MRSRQIYAMTVLVGLGLLGACEAEPPNDVQAPMPDGGMGQQQMPPPPPCSNGKIRAPQIQPPTTPTPWQSARILGTAVAGDLVVVYQDGTKRPYSVPGDFCIDLPLKAGTVNRFMLHSADRCGNESDPVAVEVTQQGTPRTGDPGKDSENVASANAGAQAETSMWLAPFDGPLDNLNDGNAGTYAGFANNWGEHWVKISFTSQRALKQVKMTAPSGCTLPEFQLYYSGLANPSPPPGTDWTKISAAATGKDTPQETFDFPGEMVTSAAHIALVTNLGHTVSTNCGWFAEAGLAISEIEAWTVSVNPGTPPSAPNCSSR
jgi:hypothetical protein